MSDIIKQILEICVIPLLGVLTSCLVKYLNTKKDQIITTTDNQLAQKYTKMINETITNCVIATNQTFTQTLKEQGKFDAEAQKTAFDKTYDAVVGILSSDIKTYISETTGDLNLYLTNLIESSVSQNK